MEVLLWALRQRRLERQGTRDLARAAATWPDLIMQRRVDPGATLAPDRSFLLSEITLTSGGPGGDRTLDPRIKSPSGRQQSGKNTLAGASNPLIQARQTPSRCCQRCCHQVPLASQVANAARRTASLRSLFRQPGRWRGRLAARSEARTLPVHAAAKTT